MKFLMPSPIAKADLYQRIWRMCVCVCVILSTNSICPPALLLPTSLEAETHSTKGYTICWFPFAKVL